MAKKGSSKWFSMEQEGRVAKYYCGKASPSSGAHISDQGDVRSAQWLIECKHRGTFDKPAKSFSVRLADFEKIVDQAWSENRGGMMVFSLYAPDSVLANQEGFVDFSVKLMTD